MSLQGIAKRIITFYWKGERREPLLFAVRSHS